MLSQVCPSVYSRPSGKTWASCSSPVPPTISVVPEGIRSASTSCRSDDPGGSSSVAASSGDEFAAAPCWPRDEPCSGRLNVVSPYGRLRPNHCHPELARY